jgi:hypothetical protein
MTPEVEEAVAELRQTFPDSAVTAVPDPQGGAYVTVDPVFIGDQWSPSHTWIKFHITFQYPYADCYPHFVAPDLRRADGAAPGEGIQVGVSAPDGHMATQLSRRSNRLDPSSDTAVVKLIKVLEWLRSR